MRHFEAWWCKCCRIATLAVVLVLYAGGASGESLLHRVVAAPTAKTLQLENGRIVRLAAIQAPNRASGGDRDDPLAQEAHARLEALALDRQVRIDPVGKGADRHGRIVAWAETAEGLLLQVEMLRAGMAWAYTFPDSRGGAVMLLAAEAEAELASRGVWAEPDYAVLTPENAGKHAGEFRLVEGTVLRVAQVRDRWYLNFGEDWKTDFTLVVERGSQRHFDPAWLRALEGKTVRARGWLFRMNGPAMELTHPEQLEVRNER